MALIQNEGRRLLGLPGRTTEAGAVAAFVLAPKGAREVPDWYVAELLEEEGLADLLSRGELAVSDDTSSSPDATPEPRLEVRHDHPEPFAEIEPGTIDAPEAYEAAKAAGRISEIVDVQVAPSKKRGRRRRGFSTGG